MEDLIKNVTVSLIAGGTTTGALPASVRATTTIYSTIYAYDSGRLWQAYRSSLGISVILGVLGTYMLMMNRFAGQVSFSQIRNPESELGQIGWRRYCRSLRTTGLARNYGEVWEVKWSGKVLLRAGKWDKWAKDRKEKLVAKWSSPTARLAGFELWIGTSRKFLVGLDLTDRS